MKKTLFFSILLCASQVLAQNPRHVVSGHPRLLINNTVTDTWQPAATRLAARSALALGGDATAAANFATLKALCTSNNPTFYNSTDEGYSNSVMAYAYVYAIYHYAGQDSTANSYAQALWNTFSTYYQAPVAITSIVTDVSGNATVTLSSPPAVALSTGCCKGIWGASNDSLNGGINITSVIDSTHFFYHPSVVSETHTESGMYYTGASLTGNDSTSQVGVQLESLAYFYDWCYDWLVANGHDAYIRDMIKAWYWSNTLTRSSSAFGAAVREADFHNYTSKNEVGILTAGVALFNDDPFGSTMLNEGAGYLWEGIQVKPVNGNSNSYEFNVKKSNDVLADGSMNWEGPTYWRSGAIRFYRGIEAYDTATGRSNTIWTSQFSTAYRGAQYKMYVMLPNGSAAAFGDASAGGTFAGRDNFGISILNDRFPDPHMVWMLNNDTAAGNLWDSGAGGFTGLVWKLIFYPYVNGPGSHDLTDLPTSAQFGTDVIVRTGWGVNDTFLTYSGSMRGNYHRHEDAGTFNIFNRDYLVLQNPYTDAVSSTYYQYNRRTIAGNTLTLRDPADCWMNNQATCGLWNGSTPLINDGGQLISWRAFNPPFSSGEFNQNRAWSGSVYSDATWGTTYTNVMPNAFPAFAAGTGYEHIRQDLTPFYSTSYTGSGHNPTLKVAASNGAIREIIHFQPTAGTLNPVVVFDRVTSTNAAFKKSWLLHTVNPPTVNGTSAPTGDSTTAAATVTQIDNGAGRLFVNHLLPASPNVRTIGGNACPITPIFSATNANPAVYYAPSHGLVVGESVRLDTGTVTTDGTGSQWQPNWVFDRVYGSSCGFNTVTTVPDADHFTVSGCNSSSSSNQPWSTAFTSGAGSPTGNGTFTGQIYYQTDAAGGNTVWQWNGASWVNLSITGSIPGKSPALGYTSPVIQSHASCNWSFYVDQLGPTGSTGAHLWETAMDATKDDAVVKWLIAESPASNSLTDNFLNVMVPTTTGGSNPVITQVTGTGIAGAVIADSAGSYVAAMPTAPTPQTDLSYTAAHAGTGKHVVGGLTPSASFMVGQNTAAQVTTPVMPPVPSTPQKVFLSTDVCGDIDDAQAISIMVKLHQMGYIQIVGANVDMQMASGFSGNGGWADGPSFVQSIFTRAGLSIPIGACAFGSCNWGEGDNYCHAAVTAIGAPRYHLSDYVESVALLRSVVNANPPGSIVLVGVGINTRTAAFMQTPANYNGDGLPSGATLWAKVKSFVSMGGVFPSGADGYNWTNENTGAPHGTSMAYIFNNSAGVPIYANPASVQMYTGGRAYYSLPDTSPLKAAIVAYRNIVPDYFTLPPSPYTAYGYGRQAWDPSTVLFAAIGTQDPGDGLGPHFTLSANGTITLTVGSTPTPDAWASSPQSGHYYVSIPRVADTRAIMEQLQQFDGLPVTTQITTSDASGAATFTETGGGTFGLTQVALTILSQSPLPAGLTGLAYNQTLSVSGGSAPYAWSIIFGALPPGLTLSPAGTIIGTPSASGAGTFTVMASDAVGIVGTKQFSITIQTPAVQSPTVRAGGQVRPGVVVH